MENLYFTVSLIHGVLGIIATVALLIVLVYAIKILKNISALVNDIRKATERVENVGKFFSSLLSNVKKSSRRTSTKK